jgi:hypothetical protein
MEDLAISAIWCFPTQVFLLVAPAIPFLYIQMIKRRAGNLEWLV